MVVRVNAFSTALEVVPGLTYTMGGFDVSLTAQADVDLLLPATSGTLALIQSPQFTGNPTTPTPPLADDDTTIANTKFVKDAIAAAIANLSPFPPGSMMPYGGATAPAGWYLCDGSAKTTAGDVALFTAIGYKFGGSGANFNIPDMSGRVPAGVDLSGTNRITSPQVAPDGDTIGAVGGSETASFVANISTVNVTGTIAGTTSATDQLNVAVTGSGSTDANVDIGNASNGTGSVFNTSNPSHLHTITNLASTGKTVLGDTLDLGGTCTATGTGVGATAASSILQPTIITNYIIKR
jgi:microcystin-dependent protein